MTNIVFRIPEQTAYEFRPASDDASHGDIAIRVENCSSAYEAAVKLRRLLNLLTHTHDLVCDVVSYRAKETV